MKRLLSVVAVAGLLVATPLAHAAGRGERKPYDCNPQQECLARAAALKGAAAEAAKRGMLFASVRSDAGPDHGCHRLRREPPR